MALGAEDGGTPAGAAGAVAPPQPERSASTILQLGVIILAWGGNYALGKLALEDSGPWGFNALRYGASVVLLGAVLLCRIGWRSLLPAPGERLAMAGVGFLQVTIMTGATTFALTLIDASRTVLIAYSMPIWGLLLSRALLGERITPAMVAGAALGIAGLALLCAPWAMDWTSRHAILGSLIALAGTIAWALGAVLYRARRWRTDFWAQIFFQLFAASAVLVPAAVLLETRPMTFTPVFSAIVAWNAVVPTIIAFWCWARVLDRVPVGKASQVLLLSPVFGVLLSALMLGEPLTPTLLASGGLILSGALLSYAPRRSGQAGSPGARREPADRPQVKTVPDRRAGHARFRDGP